MDILTLFVAICPIFMFDIPHSLTVLSYIGNVLGSWYLCGSRFCPVGLSYTRQWGIRPFMVSMVSSRVVLGWVCQPCSPLWLHVRRLLTVCCRSMVPYVSYLGWCRCLLRLRLRFPAMRLTPNLRRRSFQMVVIPGPMPYPVLSRFHFVVVPCCVFILVQLCPGCSIIPLGFFFKSFCFWWCCWPGWLLIFSTVGCSVRFFFFYCFYFSCAVGVYVSCIQLLLTWVGHVGFRGCLWCFLYAERSPLFEHRFGSGYS